MTYTFKFLMETTKLLSKKVYTTLYFFLPLEGERLISSKTLLEIFVI